MVKVAIDIGCWSSPLVVHEQFKSQRSRNEEEDDSTFTTGDIWYWRQKEGEKTADKTIESSFPQEKKIAVHLWKSKN